MDLVEVARTNSPVWWLKAFCLASSPIILCLILTLLLKIFRPLRFCCPVCGNTMLGRDSALRRLAAAHLVPFDIPLRKIRKQLVGLAAADSHQHHLITVYNHLDGNARNCSCLITLDASGRLGAANYASSGSA